MLTNRSLTEYVRIPPPAGSLQVATRVPKQHDYAAKVSITDQLEAISEARIRAMSQRLALDAIIDKLDEEEADLLRQG